MVNIGLHLTETVRGILKSRSRLSKPPVPSRSRVNAVLGVGVGSETLILDLEVFGANTPKLIS